MNKKKIAEELVRVAKMLYSKLDAKNVKQKPMPLVIDKDFFVRDGQKNVIRPEYRKSYYEKELKRLKDRIENAIKEDRAGIQVNKNILNQDKKSLKYLESINWWEMEVG